MTNKIKIGDIVYLKNFIHDRGIVIKGLDEGWYDIYWFKDKTNIMIDEPWLVLCL